MPETKSILDPYLLFYIQAVEGLPLGFSFGRTKEAGTDPVMSENLRLMGNVFMSDKTMSGGGEAEFGKVYQELFQEAIQR